MQSQTVFTFVSPSTFSAKSVLPISSVVFNIGGGLNISASKFTVPRCGLYWMHLETRTNATSIFTDLSIVSTKTEPIGIMVSSSFTNDYATLSRQDLRWIPNGTLLYVSSSKYGGQYWFWEGFNIAGLMDPLIAFCVYSNSSIVVPATPQPFPFTTVIVNEGGGWNKTSNTFTAPATGTYVMSFSVANVPNNETRFYLYLNSSLMIHVEISEIPPAGVDVASRCILVGLSKDQSIWITGDGKLSFGGKYQLTSFKGFYLSPAHGLKYAWSLYTSPTGSFTWVTLLNVGNIITTYNTTSVAVKITYAGIYYVTTAVTGYDIVWPADFRIYINSSTTFPYPEIYARQGTGGYATRSSASLIRLFVNNTVVGKRTVIYAYQPYTTFCGFLLYP